MLVLVTFIPVTDNSIEIVKVPYIYYPIQVYQDQIQALFNSGSKVNAINPDCTQKLCFKVQKTSIKAQKINNSTLETFEIAIANFQVEDKVDKPRFFQEIFLIADTKFEVVLEMFFLKLSNADVLFGKKTLTQRFYTTNKALPTTKRVWIIDKTDFAIAALNVNSEMFVIHMIIWEQEKCLYIPRNRPRLRLKPKLKPKLELGLKPRSRAYYLIKFLLSFWRNIPIIVTSSQQKMQQNFQNTLE